MTLSQKYNQMGCEAQKCQRGTVMSFSDNREVKKRINYLQSQLDLVDMAVQSLPILVANVENHQTVAQCDEAISNFKSDLQKLYRDLALFKNIKF